jgi:hypothetical protein
MLSAGKRGKKNEWMQIVWSRRHSESKINEKLLHKVKVDNARRKLHMAE